jgi:hypothetical protein
MEEAEQCDRLVGGGGGGKVAEGSLDEVVGKGSAAEVEAGDWSRALLVLEEAGWPVKLTGRRLRVPGVAPTRVEEALSAAGIEARVEERPSTLDETFVALTRS